VLTQDDLETGIEALGLEEFKVYHVPLARLAESTKLDFGSLAEHDTMAAAPETMGPALRRIERPEDYVDG
jgi:hypothetical protein